MVNIKSEVPTKKFIRWANKNDLQYYVNYDIIGNVLIKEGVKKDAAASWKSRKNKKWCTEFI